jgi:hypothetical protein
VTNTILSSSGRAGRGSHRVDTGSGWIAGTPLDGESIEVISVEFVAMSEVERTVEDVVVEVKAEELEDVVSCGRSGRAGTDLVSAGRDCGATSRSFLSSEPGTTGSASR